MGFFRVPDLLVKLSTKCLIELDAVRSPTSPLDLKFFPGLGTRSPRSSFLDANQNQKILLGDRVGLGLVDSLTDDSSTPLGSRKVLLGSEMRITDIVTSKNSLTAPPVEVGVIDQKDESMSDELKGSFMSLDDIVNSEDYTRVVSRGPNPRTTHFFGDHVLEFEGEQLMPDESKSEQSLSPHLKEGVTKPFAAWSAGKISWKMRWKKGNP
ncbi:hypothetical protein E2562_027213 [Oryza meyeriana var. granulata]|uniref:Uncharacterized protein n=1 Tax=Oryza meyeriana var. granulata TaxID=110450 RepID=A0A6G1EZM8_9ORYZ|nr:hypothetical protein E2562_027213 [Oryza meyeriana var. granulata]